MSRSTKPQSTQPPTVTFKCCWQRNYISSTETIKYESCDAEADWVWYREGRQVGACQDHVREYWLFASRGDGRGRPIVPTSANIEAYKAHKSKIARNKVQRMFQ